VTPDLTWDDLSLARWRKLGLRADSYPVARAYATPRLAWEAWSRADDLMRVVFAALPRREAMAVLVHAIRPEIEGRHTIVTPTLDIVERWTLGTATDAELAAEAAEAAGAAAAAWAAAWAAAAWAAAWASAHDRMCERIRAAVPWERVVAGVLP
jgi:hypothetical protein